MDKNLNESDNIQKIFNQIEYLKKAINEKDDLIKKLNEKLLCHEKRINNNENEIKELKETIKELKEKNGNEKKPKRSNEEIDKINKENIHKYMNNFNGSFSEILKKDLDELRDLEKNYGFLSLIGVKLLLKHNQNEIEGFIKAPDNSPYKN